MESTYPASQWGNRSVHVHPCSSDKIHHLVFALPPGERFTHSDQFRTVFAADELLYVLSGTMVIADPEHGEAALRPWTLVFTHGDLQITHVFVDGDEITGDLMTSTRDGVGYSRLGMHPQD